MQSFDEAATAAALDFPTLIDRLRAMFRAGCEVPARHVHAVKGAQGEGTVLIMPAWTGEYLGIKTVNVYAGNRAKGLPGLFATYTLFEASTGRPLAHLDGNVITARRTVAASALAASYLARKDARRLLVVGAGRIGALLPQAYRAVLPRLSCEIWARRRDAAAALVRDLSAQGIDVTVADDLEAAARRADIVSCATLAESPLVRGAWLRPGTHLDLIGSFAPSMREADDDAFAGVRLYVDTNEALQKSGELLGPMARGVLRAEDVAGTLADLCGERVRGRTHESERTVFKSVGTALEDLAAAMVVYGSRR